MRLRERSATLSWPTTVLLGTTIALAACTHATPYQPQSASSNASMPTGYSDQKLTADKYRVSFAGNQYTDRATVENYLLYRAAQLTQQKGYTGFTVERRNTDKNQSTQVNSIPGGGLGYGGLGYGGFSPYWDFYGSDFGYNGFDPYLGGSFYPDTVSVDKINKFDATAIIKMYHGSAPGNGDKSFDASQVLNSLGPTIKTPDDS